tara:strand:- start:2008 stop:3045 length:1038 start_codon:yes stop_codon:yes gene_type:complete
MKIYIYTIILVLTFYNQSIFSKNLVDTNYIEIKFISINIEETKNDKIEELKLQLIRQIFKKMLTINDYKKIYRDIDIHFTNTFIKSLIIEKESIINDLYSAKIQINFNEKSLINFLRNEKIPYVYTLPDNFFTIILDENRMQKNLLTDKNIYYKYLLSNESENNNFFKIPNLDINDRYLLNYKNVINKDTKDFKKILDKYSQNNLLLIHSVYNNNVYEINSYVFTNDEFKLVYNLSTKKVNFEEFFYNIKLATIDSWKNNNNIQNIKLNETYCFIRYLNLLELKEIISLLNEVTLIKHIKLKNISLYNNFYEIKYYGNYDILKKMLNIKGINIEFKNEECEIRFL